MNKVKIHHLCFGLGDNGLETLGVVTFEDDTCRAIEIIKPHDTILLKVGNLHFNNVKQLYKYISNELEDRFYQQ